MAIFRNGSVNGKNLDDPSFYPFYEMARQLDIPIAVRKTNRRSSQGGQTWHEERGEANMHMDWMTNTWHGIILSAVMALMGGLRFHIRFERNGIGNKPGLRFKIWMDKGPDEKGPTKPSK